MRNLKDAGGNTLNAPEGFRYYRDELPTNDDAIKAAERALREHLPLAAQGEDQARQPLPRLGLHGRQRREHRQRLLHMRDDAFAQLGDTNLADGVVQGTAPAFSVDTGRGQQTRGPRDRAAGHGTFTVPCYLTTNCSRRRRWTWTRTAIRSSTATYTANFDCIIPHAAVDDRRTPGTAVAVRARPARQGHRGRLERRSEPRAGAQLRLLRHRRDRVRRGDIPNTIGILQNMGQVPRAHRPHPAGTAQHAPPRAADGQPERVRSATPPSTSTGPTLRARR